MRAVFFIGLCLSTLFAPLPFTILIGALYIFLYSGYEAVVLGACIDALFGTALGDVHLRYTLIFFGLTVFALLLRPYIITGFNSHDAVF